ncbi:hypothetical protein NT98_1079 [Bacillus cereus]|nr:hypothetical protein NT98_1079 [Bacillus cereus]AJI03873.1 hypothetical protein AQ16_3673 [Bacillus cereus G9241]EAL14897.1 hypothetical protein membrane Spanning protein [Bacillus cereus G9241]
MVIQFLRENKAVSFVLGVTRPKKENCTSRNIFTYY